MIITPWTVIVCLLCFIFYNSCSTITITLSRTTPLSLGLKYVPTFNAAGSTLHRSLVNLYCQRSFLVCYLQFDKLLTLTLIYTVMQLRHALLSPPAVVRKIVISPEC